jgi:O-antigen ligase
MDVKLSPTYYKKGYPLIPSHSHVLGAWVEAGVLGIFFFFYIFGVAARAVYLPIRDENRLRFWIVSTSLLLLWAILFSPISARLETSFLLGAIFNQVVFSRAGLMSASGDRTQVATRRAA